MQLVSLSFTENESEPSEWILQGLTLRQQNLIVGVNASGKSRILNVIYNLARLIAGEQRPTYHSSRWEATFADGSEQFRYTLAVRDGQITSEAFSKEGTTLLTRREDGTGDVFTQELGHNLKFKSPTNEVTVATRRDSIQHPFLEPLLGWAQRVYRFEFRSEELGKTALVIVSEHQKAKSFNPRDTAQTVAIYRRGERDYGEDFKTAVRDDMARLRYPIDEIGTEPAPVTAEGILPGPVLALAVRETDLGAKTNQLFMSHGMFRALALVIQLQYARFANHASLILIDDIGEGLDYDRSRLLIGLVREKAEETGVQLVMTTNDRFVMNDVPLEDWSVLRRSGGLVKVFNFTNAKDTFDEFKVMGLNNFDFFALGFAGEAKDGP